MPASAPLRLLTFLLVLGPLRAAADDPVGLDFFESQVRPLLTKRCYACHSREAETLRGSLYLDTREGWRKGGDSGPAIVPGRPDESLLVQAVRYEGFEMPPAGKLPVEEIEILTQWVARGAPDPRTGAATVNKPPRVIDLDEGRRWWAFRPLADVAVPRPVSSWSRTPIDHFIETRLAAAQLAPQPDVDRRHLARRAYLDLLGLPPTPAELDAFLADTTPDAYERLVDRLLASPHYGERWARHWLDIVRFAESHGFEHDYDREYAYHYRDFVIRALNDDLPYDAFVAWQLAGDELAPDDPLAMAATGFLAAGVHATQITANQVEKERYDELDDMAAVTGTAFLGLTIGCARCHDHKFDPIPTLDYYRLLSTFTTTVRANLDVPVDPAGDARAKAEFDRAHAPYEEALARYDAHELPAALNRWLTERGPQQEPAWRLLEPETMASAGGATMTRQADGSVLLSGANPERDTLTFVCRTTATGLTSLRVEALADPSLVAGGPGRAANGNIQLTGVQVVAVSADGAGEPVTLSWSTARATFEQNADLAVALAIDGNAATGWAVDPQFGVDHAAVFEAASDFGFPGGTVLTVTLDFQGNTQHVIGRARLAVSSAARPVPLEGLATPEAVQALLAALQPGTIPPLSPEERTLLLNWYRPFDAEWSRLRAAADEHLRTAPQPQLVKMLISSEGVPALRLHTQGGDFLERTHLLKRGDPNQKLDEVSQGFLQVLTSAPAGEEHWQRPPPPGHHTSYRRRALAGWITDPQLGAGHLLARVIVNRLWQHHLGRGLVSTPSDFGAQGTPPSHPELLDWLAQRLIDEGWRLKSLHRLIMTSSVYRQGAAADERAAAADPDNALCWRWTPRRIEGEALRDAMLSLSGRWDPRMYGPGTLDPNQLRRSIYFTVKRSQMIPAMLVFDSPDGVTGLAQRPTTTVAPQALLLMNSPMAHDLATAWAMRLQAAAGQEPAVLVETAFREAFGRLPSEAERGATLSFLAAQTASYEQAGAEAPPQRAAADFCQMLMATNEFAYVD